MNNKIDSTIPIPDPKALCNIDSNLTVTGGVETENLIVNTVSSLEGDVVVSSSVDVAGMGTLQGGLSVTGLTNLGASNICEGNISLNNSSVTGLKDPENPQDALNYNYMSTVHPDVFQYVSTQYGSEYTWDAGTGLDWHTLQDQSYGTTNYSSMISYQGTSLQILLPGMYQITIDFNKAYAWHDLGGHMSLLLSGNPIAIGNNYTQYVDFSGSASISNNLGAMFSVSEAQVQQYTSLGLLCGSQHIILTYFNYRIIRYPYY